MRIDMADQSVLVVGGSSGIGLATAQLALECGANVTIASRNASKLCEATARFGGVVCIQPLDVTDNDAIEEMFSESAPFDHVVVSAAATKGGPIHQLSLEDAYASMNSKFWGAYRVAKAAKINAQGSLTLISGFLSHRPSASAVLQGAINAALEGLVRGLALEFAPIRVNAVSPGFVDTPLYSELEEESRRKLYETTKERLPVGRIGDPGDVARGVLFVATNPFATGSVITIDGGGTIA